MVVIVSKKGRVGDHDGRIVGLPEGPVIRKADAGHEVRGGHAVGRQAGLGPEAGHHLMQQLSGVQVAHEGDEIARGGIEEVEGWGIVLGIGLIGEATEHFQHDGRFDAVAPCSAGAGVDQRAHALPLEEGWFFVDKGHQAQGAAVGFLPQP